MSSLLCRTANLFLQLMGPCSAFIKHGRPFSMPRSHSTGRSENLRQACPYTCTYPCGLTQTYLLYRDMVLRAKRALTTGQLVFSYSRVLRLVNKKDNRHVWDQVSRGSGPLDFGNWAGWAYKAAPPSSWGMWHGPPRPAISLRRVALCCCC